MQKPTRKIVRHIDEFEETVSLYQLIPAGQGKGITFLKKLVDQVHNDSFSKVPLYRTPSVLICGKEGKGLISKTYLRALGVEKIVEIEASFIEGESYLLAFLHGSNCNAGFIIHHIDKLNDGLRNYIWEVVKHRKFSMYNFLNHFKENHSVRGFLVLTSGDKKKVHKAIIDAVDFIVELENYTQQQLELIVLQRLKFAGLNYENEEVLKEIIEYGNGQLRHTIKFLKDCYTVIRADGRDKLMLSDIQRAVRLR